MQRFMLFLARTAITAWVGAAVLFVVVGISEVIHPGFSSEIRDQLVIIRFPWYYGFGMTLLTAGLMGTLASGDELSTNCRILATGLIALALVVMIAEYFAVYIPLADMITPAGKPRPPEFTAYHRASMWINLASLLLSLFATGLLNWPAKP